MDGYFGSVYARRAHSLHRMSFRSQFVVLAAFIFRLYLFIVGNLLRALHALNFVVYFLVGGIGHGQCLHIHTLT